MYSVLNACIVLERGEIHHPGGIERSPPGILFPFQQGPGDKQNPPIADPAIRTQFPPGIQPVGNLWCRGRQRGHITPEFEVKNLIYPSTPS